MGENLLSFRMARTINERLYMKIGDNITTYQTFPYVDDIISPSGLPIAVDISKNAVNITHHTPDFIVTISLAGMKALEDSLK